MAREQVQRIVEATPAHPPLSSSRREVSNRRSFRFHFDPALLFVLPISIFLAFYNLGGKSVWRGDEATHVGVAQEMWLRGTWWKPTLDTHPYFNKPPLKFWLSQVSIGLFGESNFSYRFWDALAGVGTVVIIFFFAKALFRSRLAAIVSSLTLLSSSAYLFVHGIRMAVQDSLLIFFATASIYVGWRLIRRPPSPGIATLGGLLVGLSILSKNVAGTLPLLILGIYVLAQSRLILKSHRKELAIVLGIAVLLPAMYIIPHLIFTRGAFENFFVYEVWNRVTVGYHRKQHYLFYFQELFGGGVFPPMLIVPALAIACYHAMRNQSEPFRFVLLWAALPYAIFSLIQSKLSWYVAPAYPAIAIIVGGSAHTLWETLLRTLHNRAHAARFRYSVSLVASVAVLFLGSAALAGGLSANVREVLAPQKKLEMEEIATTVRDHIRNSNGNCSFILYKRPLIGRAEKIYVRQLRQWMKKSRSGDVADIYIREGREFYLLANKDDLPPEFIAKSDMQYKINPRGDRHNSVMILHFAGKL